MRHVSTLFYVRALVCERLGGDTIAAILAMRTLVTILGLVVSISAVGAPPASTIEANRVLLMGAALGRADLVAHALAQGAEPNARDEHNGNTALHMAAHPPDMEVLDYLLTSGPEPTIGSSQE